MDKADDLRIHFLLRPDVVFLNHGSFGACPQAVFATYQAWQLELERQPVEFLGRRYATLMHTAREALGAFLGAYADNLVYVPNATTALNAVARSLPLAPGDEVLATTHEYSAMDRMWQFVCARRGAHYVQQPLPFPFATPDEVVAAIWAGVTERTRVLFMSHITSPTAVILPIAKLVRRAHAHGIITVIDGAHAPGQVPLALDESGVDFYAGNCHKWMLAPKGAGFLYVRPRMHAVLTPLVVSWGQRDDPPPPPRLIDEQEYQGTRDIAAYLAVPAAIAWMDAHQWPAVQQRCHDLLRQARQQITALTGIPPCTPDDSQWFRQMAALPLPPCDAAVLKQRLYDEWQIEVPLVTWNGQLFIRVSIQGYNTPADVAALVAALTVLLPQVQYTPTD